MPETNPRGCVCEQTIGMALYPLVHVLGWPLVQVQLLLSRIRLELSSSMVRPYVWIQIVYAKKPEIA